MKNQKEIEALIHYNFTNAALLEQAFTTRGYAAEHNIAYNSELLEFYGDAVVQMAVTKMLFADAEITNEGLKYNTDEGELSQKRTNLVCGTNLANVVKHLGISDFVRRTSYEVIEKTDENVYESLVAAICLDGGMKAGERFVEQTIDTVEFSLNPIAKLRSLYNIDVKTKKSESEYITVITVIFADDEKVIFNGKGNTKKAAEANAAREALEYWSTPSEVLMNDIVDALTNFHDTNPTRALNYLTDKNLISKPNISFEELDSDTGVKWQCKILINEAYTTFEAVAPSKKEAQRLCSEEAITHLVNYYNEPDGFYFDQMLESDEEAKS